MDKKLDKVIKAIKGEIEAFGEVMDVSRFRELQEQLEKFLITDPLTGVLNRWKFTEVLKREIHSAKKLKKPLCLMMIDVDKFKACNDTYGHLMGDEVLKRVAYDVEYEAERTIGETHHLSRWGGDEFLYVMPLTDIKRSKNVAKKMVERVYKNDFFGDGRNIKISIGISKLKKDDEIFELINRADKAMYRAKKKGGNKVEIM